MTDDDPAVAWWHTLAPEARQSWIIHITGWTMAGVIDAAHRHATNAEAPTVTAPALPEPEPISPQVCPQELGITEP